MRTKPLRLDDDVCDIDAIFIARRSSVGRACCLLRPTLGAKGLLLWALDSAAQNFQWRMMTNSAAQEQPADHGKTGGRGKCDD